jgi:DNA-binding XRE family transcriptional regulator
MSMNAEIRVLHEQDGRDGILLSVPSNKTLAVLKAIRGILPLAGLKPRRVNEEGEELIPAAEVFPDGNPAMALRGLRVKEGITQAELAERLGISQNMVSSMESGKRAITAKMARRIEQEFGVTYKAFL